MSPQNKLCLSLNMISTTPRKCVVVFIVCSLDALFVRLLLAFAFHVLLEREFFFISFVVSFHSQIFLQNRIVENTGTYLMKDSVHIATAQNDCCCHVATETHNISLEQISDVEISQPCFPSCFGLRKYIWFRDRKLNPT